MPDEVGREAGLTVFRIMIVARLGRGSPCCQASASSLCATVVYSLLEGALSGDIHADLVIEHSDRNGGLMIQCQEGVTTLRVPEGTSETQMLYPVKVPGSCLLR
jgi:hypothetical protein